MEIISNKTPHLLIDKQKAIRNLKKISVKYRNSGIVFRPHFKTHQSLEIGKWFSAERVKKITVSSVTMAAYFAGNGWDDITIAFPFNIYEYYDIAALAEVARICLTVPSPESAKLLADICVTNIDVMIEIDTGHGRSGTEWDDFDTIKSCADILNSNSHINLSGLLTHSGNTYKAKGVPEIEAIYSETVENINRSHNALGINNLLISVGDTPSSSVVTNFENIDESRPGNFIFYDLMQNNIGSCKLEDISIAAVCPIVDIRRHSGTIVIYGGGVHLSKESVFINNRLVFGLAVKLHENGWDFFPDNNYVTELSQEHGIITGSRNLLNSYNIGDMIGIIPVHSCLTANLMGEYYMFNGTRIDHL
ncbi:MAG: alanine racemase [Bacteroidales bacterium]|nr:alanine racemase [Bacteroidales bacterium]